MKEGERVVFMNMSDALVELIRERNIAEVVKNQGRLVIATVNSDYDKEGNFIGDYSEAFAIAKKYERIYYPERFSD